MGNKVYILQYLRKGLINNLNKNANVAQDARRAQIDINLKFNVKNASTGKMQSKVFPGQKIELLGPVDVKSVRSKAICRVSPAEPASKEESLVAVRRMRNTPDEIPPQGVNSKTVQ